MLVIETPGQEFFPECSYVAKLVFGDFMGLPVEIIAGNDPHQWRISVENNRFSLPNKVFLRGKYPAILGSVLAPFTRVAFKGPLHKHTDLIAPYVIGEGTATEDIDVLGSIFYYLTCAEHCSNLPRSQYGTLEAKASPVALYGDVSRPVVDELVGYLKHLLARVGVFSVYKAKYSLHVSCDVDMPSLWYGVSHGKVLKHLLGSIIKYKSVNRFKSALLPWLDLSKDPYYSFPWYMDLLERHGLTGCFNFMGGASNPDYDVPYDLSEEWMQRLLCSIAERNHIIGFHPSFEAAQSSDLFAKELEHLNSAVGDKQHVDGGRHHYLRFLGPKTWRMWADSGLKWDSSVGYNDAVGFRCGTAKSYCVFDIEERKQLSLTEKPLIVMEGSMLYEMKLGSCNIVKTLKKLADEVVFHGGNMSLLWHNSQLNGEEQKKLFNSAIEVLLP